MIIEEKDRVVFEFLGGGYSDSGRLTTGTVVRSNKWWCSGSSSSSRSSRS